MVQGDGGQRGGRGARAGRGARFARRALPRGIRLLDRWAGDDRLVWLLGAPRTGSTWVSRLLAAHPDVALVDEPLAGAHLGVPTRAVLPHLATAGEHDPPLIEDNRDRDDYLLADAASGQWRPLLRSLLRSRLLDPHAAVLDRGGLVVVKEPHGSEAAELLLSLLPATRLLFLVRDPRDVLDSILAIIVHGWQGAPGTGALPPSERRRLLAGELALLRRRYEAVERAYDRLPEDRRLRVRYEDLLGDTGTGLRQLLAWLGLAVDERWLADTVSRLDFSRVPAEQTGPGRFHRAATPGLWREHFDEEEQAWLCDELSGILERHGYPRDAG